LLEHALTFSHWLPYEPILQSQTPVDLEQLKPLLSPPDVEQAQEEHVDVPSEVPPEDSQYPFEHWPHVLTF